VRYSLNCARNYRVPLKKTPYVYARSFVADFTPHNSPYAFRFAGSVASGSSSHANLQSQFVGPAKPTICLSGPPNHCIQQNEIKDRKKKLSNTPLRGEICNPELYSAVVRLSGFITREAFDKPKAF
jgi:hypothetical protein